MVVAVTYDKETGNVGQHFGHADFFKLYEIENGKIMDSAVVSPFGQGHEAVASTMEDYSVSLVICQNTGDGCPAGLVCLWDSSMSECGRTGCDAIEAFMQGSLLIADALNCDCDHSTGGCCGGSDGACGSGCGGCCH